MSGDRGEVRTDIGYGWRLGGRGGGGGGGLSFLLYEECDREGDWGPTSSEASEDEWLLPPFPNGQVPGKPVETSPAYEVP